VPLYAGQECFPKLGIAGEEEPVLRRDYRRRSISGAELQTAEHESSSKVGLAFHEVLFEMNLEEIVLLASAQIGDISQYQRVTVSQKFSSVDHTGCRDRTLTGFIVCLLGRHDGTQERPDRLVVGGDEIGAKLSRIDERTK